MSSIVHVNNESKAWSIFPSILRTTVFVYSVKTKFFRKVFHRLRFSVWKAISIFPISLFCLMFCSFLKLSFKWKIKSNQNWIWSTINLLDVIHVHCFVGIWWSCMDLVKFTGLCNRYTYVHMSPHPHSQTPVEYTESSREIVCTKQLEHTKGRKSENQSDIMMLKPQQRRPNTEILCGLWHTRTTRAQIEHSPNRVGTYTQYANHNVSFSRLQIDILCYACMYEVKIAVGNLDIKNAQQMYCKSLLWFMFSMFVRSPVRSFIHFIFTIYHLQYMSTSFSVASDSCQVYQKWAIVERQGERVRVTKEGGRQWKAAG